MNIFRIWPRQDGKALALAEQSRHLIPHVSDRGFLFMPSVSGTYPADQVGLSESSSATEACIWLRANQSGTRQTSVHLTLEEAAKLRDQITYLIENHYQVKPR
jgi:hypothetical protein